MAVSQINKLQPVLEKSLVRLSSITSKSYNDSIRQVALDMWKKHLNPENPQWDYVTFKPFYISENHQAAHVMAMIDKRLPGKGIVGYFACTDSHTGAEVLRQACEWLKIKHGIDEVYGPINGTLPNDYRLNLSDDYVFPGEPVNPSHHIEAFTKAGFRVFNRYVSGRLKHFNFWLLPMLSKSTRVDKRFKVREFSDQNQQVDFEIYHNLRNLIFPFQSIYCPAISLEERIYNSPGKFDPKYTYFLVDNDREVGFIMAYIYKQQLIIKTIGLLPEYRGMKLSRLLLRPIHKQAVREGITTVIYGMVREGNRVYKNKHPMVRIFRNYVTMSKYQ